MPGCLVLRGDGSVACYGHIIPVSIMYRLGHHHHHHHQINRSPTLLTRPSVPYSAPGHPLSNTPVQSRSVPVPLPVTFLVCLALCPVFLLASHHLQFHHSFPVRPLFRPSTCSFLSSVYYLAPSLVVSPISLLPTSLSALSFYLLRPSLCLNSQIQVPFCLQSSKLAFLPVLMFIFSASLPCLTLTTVSSLP